MGVLDINRKMLIAFVVLFDRTTFNATPDLLGFSANGFSESVFRKRFPMRRKLWR